MAATQAVTASACARPSLPTRTSAVATASTSSGAPSTFVVSMTESTIDSEGFKGGTRGAPIMPRDAVSRTANVGTVGTNGLSGMFFFW